MGVVPQRALLWLALFGVAARAPVVTQLMPPPGSGLPAVVDVEWVGADGLPLTSAREAVREGRVSLPAEPAGAAGVRIVGAEVLSDVVPVGKLESGIRLRAAGVLDITGLPSGPRSVRVWLQITGSALGFSRELPPSTTNTVRIPVPLGTHTVVLDAGPDIPPRMFSDVAVAPGRRVGLSVAGPAGERLALSVKSRDGGPIAGASVQLEGTAANSTPYGSALSRRCGSSGTDGHMDCGRLAEGLESARVVAPGWRSGRIPPPRAEDAGAPRQVVLRRPQRVEAVVDGVRKEDLRKGPQVRLGRCEGRGCSVAHWSSAPLGAGGEATFHEVAPGSYRIAVEVPGLPRSDTVGVDVSSRSEDPDFVVGRLEVRRWRVVGTTRLTDGASVASRVTVEHLPAGSDRTREVVATGETDESGGFELTFYSRPGGWLLLRGASIDGAAEGSTPPPGFLLDDNKADVAADLELSQAGLGVRVTDRSTGRPLADCSAVFNHWRREWGGVEVRKTDADGLAALAGIREGLALAKVHCSGYRSASTEKKALTDSFVTVELRLDRATSTRVRVRSATGRPLPGAAVYLDQSRFEDVRFPFFVPPDVAGTTDLDGELTLEGAESRGLYVAAPGHALFVGRVPGCASREPCELDVGLTAPTAFPGIRATSTRGPVPAAWLLFSADGVPIPAPLLQELVRLNGGDSGRFFVSDRNGESTQLLPSLFGPGAYLVEAMLPSEGPIPRRVPLGVIQIPAAEFVELSIPPSVDLGTVPP